MRSKQSERDNTLISTKIRYESAVSLFCLTLKTFDESIVRSRKNSTKESMCYVDIERTNRITSQEESSSLSLHKIRKTFSVDNSQCESFDILTRRLKTDRAPKVFTSILLQNEVSQ